MTASIELMWWGDDGKWIAAVGHHDKQAFAAAADAEYAAATDIDEPKLSEAFRVRHAWFRPVTRDWFEEHVVRGAYFADRDFKERLWAEWKEMGALEACESTDDGATPYTIISTGA